MSERVLEGVIQLNKNLDRLLSEYNKLRNINDDMQKELLDISTKLHRVESEYSDLKRSYERIKLTSALTGDGEGSREAKRKLNSLVREIDNCIALLNR